LILDSSFWDTFKSIGDQLAKTVAGNVTLAGMSLIVLIFVGSAVLLKRRDFLIAAFVLGLISILLIGALSFGSSLPLWYAVVLIGAAGAALAVGTAWWIRTQPKPPNEVSPPASLLPALQKLDDKTIAAVTGVMERAADEVATALKIVKDKVRASVFAPSADNCLKSVAMLAVRINDPAELTLEIPIGTGVVGTAWKLQKLMWARFDAKALSQPEPWYGIPYDQATKVNKELKWVIALPTPPSGSRFAWTVEGLEDCTDRDLGETIPKLFAWSHALDAYLKDVRLL
jgi:hypothetical protein